MDIIDEKGNPVNTKALEVEEQELARTYIQEDDVVLELGARYGSVSCIINSKLKDKTNQVVVEPDERVWAALERNKQANGCEFHIVKGFLSSKKLDLTNLNAWHGGYAATAEEVEESKIPSYTLSHIYMEYGLNFNVLVADCEGFLETFFDENPDIYDWLSLVMFEADYPQKCNYAKIYATLEQKGFKCIKKGFQNVYSKR
jgi:FkbM family methyltransferase